jgi:hypothetical protein
VKVNDEETVGYDPDVYPFVREPPQGRARSRDGLHIFEELSLGHGEPVNPFIVVDVPDAPLRKAVGVLLKAQFVLGSPKPLRHDGAHRPIEVGAHPSRSTPSTKESPIGHLPSSVVRDIGGLVPALSATFQESK